MLVYPKITGCHTQGKKQREKYVSWCIEIGNSNSKVHILNDKLINSKDLIEIQHIFHLFFPSKRLYPTLS